MPLTNTALQNAKPTEKPYKIYDVDGLFMQVMPAGVSGGVLSIVLRVKKNFFRSVHTLKYL